MPKYLVIVEAPGKLKKFQSILGPDYKVLASKGHVVDLPAKGKNVKINQDKQTGVYTFTPNYAVMEDKEDVVHGIVQEANKKYDKIYLMTDPDREGEAIAWHIKNQLPTGAKIARATTTSITKAAVDEALKNAGTIDQPMVDSYETRRILDRLTGYEASYPVKTATGGKSVGRVQSAALRILAEREKEIKSFIPEEYWDIDAELLTDKKEKLWAKLSKPGDKEVKNKEQADKIVNDLKTLKKVAVSSYETKNVKTHAYAPFTTSTLQQAASSVLGWNGKKTMQIAQTLYEAGDITYMRTDSVFMSPGAVNSIRSYIDHTYGPKYLPSTANFYKTAAKNAQEGHECCRVVDEKKINAGNTLDEQKLYALIWKRTVASQMEESEHLSLSVKFKAGEYEFSANGRKLLFDGWKKVYDYSLGDDIILPEMKVGDILDIIDITSVQKFTQPPPRFNDGGSFTKMMETAGIGRPATYTATLETLKARSYITVESKAIHVTDLGLAVVDFCKNVNFCFIDVEFTSHMEENLDLIAEKKSTKSDILNEFYKRLKDDLANAQQQKTKNQESDIPCPKCGKLLLKKHSMYGPFFACPDRKECGYKANVGEDGKPKEPPPKPPKVYGPYPCPKCGSKMVLRTSKLGNFYGCEKFPKCRSMVSETGQPIESKKPSFKKGFKKWHKKGSSHAEKES